MYEYRVFRICITPHATVSKHVEVNDVTSHCRFSFLLSFVRWEPLVYHCASAALIFDLWS